jgi:hypothetical protein
VSVEKAPAGLGVAGRRLWRSVLRDFDLAEHERLLLAQAAHVADVCALLQVQVDADGPLSVSRLGERRSHPALVELRAQRLLLARLIVALRVPLGDQEQHGPPRGQLRALRGVYGGAS